MKHTILRAFMMICAVAVPTAVMAADELAVESIAKSEEVSMELVAEFAEPVLTVRGNVVQVQNAQGAELEVYDITGKRVAVIAIDSNDKVVTLNLRKGFYIIRVGKLTRKISLQ